jgi:hypothetical protein
MILPGDQEKLTLRSLAPSYCVSFTLSAKATGSFRDDWRNTQDCVVGLGGLELQTKRLAEETIRSSTLAPSPYGFATIRRLRTPSATAWAIRSMCP